MAEQLTNREREVLALIVAGSTDQEIGESLGISRGTVSNHVSAILGKLQARSRAEAVREALLRGLVPIDEV